MMRRLAVLALLVAPLSATFAQTSPPRRRATNEHAWLQLYGEQRLAPRWWLYGEAQVRRADLDLSAPQQLLLRPGIVYDANPGLRLGAGYGYVATSVYGDAPAAAPFPEHRLWQQLQIASRTGPIAWSHRLRAEQRWVGQTVALPDGDHEVTAWRFRQRARGMTRATVDAPTLGIPMRRAYLTAHGELFVQVGATPDGQVFDQSRVALQGGWRFSPDVRMEAGYMQQLIQRGGSRVTENNHTLLVSVFATRR